MCPEVSGVYSLLVLPPCGRKHTVLGFNTSNEAKTTQISIHNLFIWLRNHLNKVYGSIYNIIHLSPRRVHVPTPCAQIV